ncbi:hypothetical protein PENTCL1PPCAC_19504, partial [Pristionchus entomophagus]
EMNEAVRPFIYRTDLIDRELFLFNFIQIEYLTSARTFYFTVVVIEAVFCIFSICVSFLLIVRSMQHPPMHINPCIITIYDVSVMIVSNAARFGQILYESRVIERSNGLLN